MKYHFVALSSMTPILSSLVPITYFVISTAISLVALDAPQSQRNYLSLPIILFAALSFHRLNDISSQYGLDSLWGLFIIVYIFHITAVLFIERWVLKPLDNTSSKRDLSNLPEFLPQWNIIAAYKVWANPRWLPSPLILPPANTLKALPYHNSDPPATSKPSTRTVTIFTLVRLTKLSAYALIYHLASNHLFPGHFRPMSPDDFSPQRERYISRLFNLPSSLPSTPITTRETFVRTALALDWVLAAYLILSASNLLLSLIFVCILRVDKPEEWPPLFGSITTITSVRRFWSRFWHRMAVGPYSSYAKVLARRVLRCEPEGRVEALVVVVCCFAFSGLAHEAVSWRRGERCGVGRDAVWFMLNFGAGAVEVVVLGEFGRWARGLGREERYQRFVRGWGGRVLGGCWVFGFFFWSVPKWYFPKLYCATLKEIYTQ